MEKKKDILKEEEQYLGFVIDEINHKIHFLEKDVGRLKENVISLRKDFWDDVTVNMDEPDDVIETATSIKQQAELLSERERSHKQYYSQLHTLNKLKQSPYFGRIDFREKGEEATDKIYIGIASFRDKEEDDFLIYDWRAPVCSLYYDFPPGPAKYRTPMGMIAGEIELKRQYIIKASNIEGLFDTGITIGDEMLREVLGNNANTQMKSIVATIQKEQNQIIRNETSKYLVVQGVAGSGKTSAALQRVAYLLYRYRDELTSENIMLFSPNTLFNSYVATVLPELGEENMEQRTFYEFLRTRLGKQLKLEDPFTQMEYFYTGTEDTSFDLRLSSIQYKSSLDYKTMLDHYLQYLSNEGIIFKSIMFRGKVIIPAEKIREAFYLQDDRKPISFRLGQVMDWLIIEINALEKKERTKDWVVEEMELLDKEQYLKIYKELQNTQMFSENTFDDFTREEKLLAKVIVKNKFKPIKRKIKQLKFIDVLALYKQLFQLSSNNLGNLLKIPENWEEICEHSLQYLEKRELTFEDGPAYLYLHDQLKGQNLAPTIRHLFIDEAQDYTPFQFALLNFLYPNCKMTILGDFNQAIYAHAFHANTILSNDLYDSENFEKINLTRSYRSTKQISNFTKELLDGGDEIQVFNRNGSLPTFIQVENQKELHFKVMDAVQQFRGKKYETIAIICKTARESVEAYQELKSVLDVKLITKETATFNKGILILPAYLAKGIEFDAVIIYNCSNTQYGHNRERKLFYTACTRAMHELHLFSIGKRSFFFDGIPNDKYLEM